MRHRRKPHRANLLPITGPHLFPSGPARGAAPIARTRPHRRRGDADAPRHHDACRRHPDTVCRQHRVHADLLRPGDADDPGPGLLLRRHGPRQEHPQHADDELHQPRDRHDPVGALRVQPRLRHGHRLRRRLELGLPRAQRDRRHPALGRLHDPGLRLRRLPADVRRAHPGPDQRRPRRPGQIHLVGPVHHALGHRRLLPRRPLGLGRGRLAVRDGRHRLRGRHGRPHQRGCGGARRDPRHRQARRLQEGPDAAAQPAARHARRRSALVRLVRLQQPARGSATTTVSAR